MSFPLEGLMRVLGPCSDCGAPDGKWRVLGTDRIQCRGCILSVLDAPAQAWRLDLTYRAPRHLDAAWADLAMSCGGELTSFGAVMGGRRDASLLFTARADAERCEKLLGALAAKRTELALEWAVASDGAGAAPLPPAEARMLTDRDDTRDLGDES